MKSNTQIGYGALAVAGLCLLLGSVANAAPTGKTLICHMPGERGQRILNVNLDKDGAKHQAHGDEIPLKECDIPLDNKNNDCDSTTDEDDGAVSGICDDLDVLTADSCDSNGTCANVLFCGNGQTDPDEECDDGNNNDGDGCSAICEDETLPPACPCIDFWEGANDQNISFPTDYTAPFQKAIGSICLTNPIYDDADLSFIAVSLINASPSQCIAQKAGQAVMSTDAPQLDLAGIQACIRYVETTVPVTNGCLTE